jgi:hypothetical protein
MVVLYVQPAICLRLLLASLLKQKDNFYLLQSLEAAKKYLHDEESHVLLPPGISGNKQRPAGR